MDGQGLEESRALRTSATGRIPQWVRDEAAELAGRPVDLRPSPAVTRVLTGPAPDRS